VSERDLHEDAQGAPETGRGAWDPEAPDADAAEQRADLRGPDSAGYVPAAADVDEADAAEQQQVVEIDEDDYDR
jgi:hypothetical protein